MTFLAIALTLLFAGALLLGALWRTVLWAALQPAMIYLNENNPHAVEWLQGRKAKREGVALGFVVQS